MTEHVALVDGQIHAPQNWTYADATARAAAVITDATLVGRLAYQTDTGIYYRLASASPAVWSQVTIPAANTILSGTTTVATLAATTINAFTLGGTISGGGKNINNIIIGATTPLAGNFTTIGATGAATVGTTLGVTGVSTLTGGAVIGGLTVSKGAGAVTSNTVVGNGALAANTTGANNTSVGRLNSASVTGGSGNTSVGANCFQVGGGSNNVVIGYLAQGSGATGDDNVNVGYAAANGATGNQNTNLGSSAGGALTSGGNNATLGYLSGNDALLSLTTESNQVVVGNNSTTNATVKVLWTIISDARDKYVVGDVPHGLDFVLGLSPRAYKLKAKREDEKAPENAALRYGFLAQDILALEGGSSVIINSTDSDKLKYTESYLIPVLVNSIKELSAKVDALQASSGGK